VYRCKLDQIDLTAGTVSMGTNRDCSERGEIETDMKDKVMRALEEEPGSYEDEIHIKDEGL